MLTSHRYTLFGIAAILLWSCLIGLLRHVTEQLGPIGGAAMIYSVSSIFLMFVLGFPKLKNFSWSYLLIGGVLFASYESCFSLALGFANNRLQTIEMGVINYLWPSLTVLFAVCIGKRARKKNKASSQNNQKAPHWFIYPSILLAFFGVVWSLIGEQGLSLSRLAANIASNPLAYSLAFAGAIIWALYCNVTKHLANGNNGITIFFILTAIALWTQYAISDEPVMHFSINAVVELLLTSMVMASGYALWNAAIIGGNMVFLATISYFTPIFSTFLSTFILGVTLGNTFWQGVILVTIGSLMCWKATSNVK